jgi:ATP-dependent Clp protease ATP-binding subunit ClpA
MYPFERFTERARRVLTFAQEEAEKGHQSYIGTEHLLLGLLREKEGVAAGGLESLGVRPDQVRETIEAVLRRDEQIVVQQIIPTSRVKKVIEISFEEARRMGHNYVGTEHLLLGLLIEGEGVAAHVLGDLGVTLDAVRAEVDRQLAFVGEEEGDALPTPPQSAGQFPAPSVHVRNLLRKAGEEAGRQGVAVIGVEQLLRALTGPQGFEALTAVLDSQGIPWKGSEEMTRLAERAHQVRASAMEAAARRDHEAAARLLSEEARLLEEYGQAERDWLQH